MKLEFDVFDFLFLIFDFDYNEIRAKSPVHFFAFTSLVCSGTDELRARFVYTYYAGDFPKAHTQLSDAFSDPVIRSIWEERIHHHGNIDDCKYESTAGARGFALLKTGDIEGAAKVFQKDWLSLLGKATISVWQNEAYAARQHALEALELAPERPEPYYFAGNLSRSTDESTGHFLKFLELVKEDPYKKQSVEYAIEFMNRTRGMELNIATKLERFRRAGFQTSGWQTFCKSQNRWRQENFIAC